MGIQNRHVVHMGDGNAYIILVWKSEGKRPHERY
jgi:hypothetical protein